MTTFGWLLTAVALGVVAVVTGAVLFVASVIFPPDPEEADWFQDAERQR